MSNHGAQRREGWGARLAGQFDLYICVRLHLHFFFFLITIYSKYSTSTNLHDTVASSATDGGVCASMARERKRERRRRRTSGVSFKEEATDRTPAATWWSVTWEPPLLALRGPISLPIFGRGWEPAKGATPAEPFMDLNRLPSRRPLC